MSTDTINSGNRFGPSNPCPICGGHAMLPHGKGRRCAGFMSTDGKYAYCTREEHAGGLDPSDTEPAAFAHKIAGTCRCGSEHGGWTPEPPKSGRAPVVATYDYFTRTGVLAYQVVRRADKSFTQRRPDGAGGWIYNLDGVERVLYRTPEVLDADPAEIVYVVEGEKDVDALVIRGLVATCNSGGAGKWPAEQSALLAGRTVAIIPDNDDPGRRHAAQVLAALRPHVASVRLLELGGLPHKGDVSDWLAAGGTVDELRALAVSEEREPGSDDDEEGDELPPSPVPRDAISATWSPLDPRVLAEPPPARRWLLRRPTKDGQPCPPSLGDGLLPLGKVGLLVADGGVGKTMALVALAISAITGRPWLDVFHVPIETTGRRVLLALGEEDAEEVHRRLYGVATALGLTDHERDVVAKQLVVLPLAGHPVAIVNDAGKATPELRGLQERLAADGGETGWSLVGMDPFSRFAAAESELDNAVATRTIQAAETLVTAPGGPTVLIAHHASLDGTKTKDIRARGVTGIRNAVRWEAILRADGGDVFFRQSKSNYSRQMAEEIRLVRGAEGILRAASQAEEEARQAAREEAQDAAQGAKDARREARVLALMDRYLAALEVAREPVVSQRVLVALVPGKQIDRVEAVSRLLASGRIVRPLDKSEGYRVAGRFQ
jgi:RecA-family ATPase